MPALRVAVIGTGAFGRNHLRVYRELETVHPELVQLVAFVDASEPRRAEYAAQCDLPAFETVGQLIAATPIDAASVCVPTIHHAEVAEQLLYAGIDVLIEKPFAASLAEADHLLDLAQQHKRIVAVGHLERFNPAVTATLAALNKPMFFESHRLSIFTPRSLDVDVVLDLMIHDLDIVLSLTNSPVREVRAVGLPILSRKVDIANVRLEFESGCIANFTASRVSTEQVRKLRLFQPHQYLSLDFARQELLTIAVDPAVVAAAMAGVTLSPATVATSMGGASGTPHPAAAAHPTAGLDLSKADIVKGEPLRLEIEDFLQSVRDRTPPRVPGTAGRAALALALEINGQIASHAKRAGLI
ncbi:Gfo/Idh/MocA family protein [Granulicella paludicola]|uniref:Gfo/Idh/MocA family protein n=1 Tax=Granulicella paludicola TaxID=474951 RepID=UPI0021E03FDC|nr:Gfo/Idh/MocA family oxidoreductase [Granulicella paludicola]